MSRFRKRLPFDLCKGLNSGNDIARNDWVSGYCALARQANLSEALKSQFQNTVRRYVRRKHTAKSLPNDHARSLLFKRWRADHGPGHSQCLRSAVHLGLRTSWCPSK